jgi:formylglycine-generating enzyme required for sulfatase activity
MIRSCACVLATVCLFCQTPMKAVAQPAAGIPMIHIRAAGDSFLMGDGVLGPNVAQTITEDFSISQFPIINSQFGEFIADGGYTECGYWTTNGWEWKGRTAQPAFWKDTKFNGPHQPAVGVSWYEAVAFCNWLSAKEGLAPAYDHSGSVDLKANGYRLPTEVEWEYAAAKGAPDREERIYPWGDSWDSRNAVCRVSPAKASCTAQAGGKSPRGDTPDGLVDMAGNVWEWCSDNSQSDNKIKAGTRVDRYFFRSDAKTEYMVLRGGSWWNDFKNGFRAAFRNYTTVPGSRLDVAGFRVARRLGER